MHKEHSTELRSEQSPKHDLRATHLANIAPRTCALMRKHIEAEADRRVNGERATAAIVLAEMLEMRDLSLEVESDRDRLAAQNAELATALEAFAARAEDEFHLTFAGEIKAARKLLSKIKDHA